MEIETLQSEVNGRPTCEIYQTKVKECESLKRNILEMQVSSSKLQHKMNRKQFTSEHLDRSDSCVQTEQNDADALQASGAAAILDEHVQKTSSHLLSTNTHQETLVPNDESLDFESATDEFIVSMCPSGVEDCSIDPASHENFEKTHHHHYHHQHHHHHNNHPNNRDSGVSCDDDAFFVPLKQNIQTFGIEHHPVSTTTIDTAADVDVGHECSLKQMKSLEINGTCISDNTPNQQQQEQQQQQQQISEQFISEDVQMLNDPDVQREEELVAFKEECSRLFDSNLQMKNQINALQIKLSHGGVAMTSNLFIFLPIIIGLIGYIIISPYL